MNNLVCGKACLRLSRGDKFYLKRCINMQYPAFINHGVVNAAGYSDPSSDAQGRQWTPRARVIEQLTDRIISYDLSETALIERVVDKVISIWLD